MRLSPQLTSCRGRRGVGGLAGADRIPGMLHGRETLTYQDDDDARQLWRVWLWTTEAANIPMAPQSGGKYC